MGLNDSYIAIRGQILLMQSIPSIKKAYSMIMQEEQQREVGDYNPSDVAKMSSHPIAQKDHLRQIKHNPLQTCRRRTQVH
ncbi:unnamed protein product [Prunus armeniaca]